jgi:hypothetical protein
MAKITLKRWSPGLEKITLTKTLQEKAGLSLTLAKECVDRLLVGEEVTLDLPTSQEAVHLGEAVTALGVDCEVDTTDGSAIREAG